MSARRTTIRLPSSLRKAPHQLWLGGAPINCGPSRSSSLWSWVSVTGWRAGGDDHAHGRRLGRGEALPQHRLEEAQLHAAVDRAARGEGDEQRLGAVGAADGDPRGAVDLAESLLERGEAAGELDVGERRAGRESAGGG